MTVQPIRLFGDPVLRTPATPVVDFDADGMPAPVAMSRAGVADVVLLAQFVGDVGGCRIQVARVPDNLGAPAAVVGDFTQGRDVHPVAATG